jgi:integrase
MSGNMFGYKYDKSELVMKKKLVMVRNKHDKSDVMCSEMKSNHPSKGSQLKTEPIRDREDIRRIKDLLVSKPRNLALFTLGINTNLRASDLVNLRTKQVQVLTPDQSFEIREKKTGKMRRLTLNNGALKAVHDWIRFGNLSPETPLFLSQRNGTALTVSSVNRLVKGWCKAIGLQGQFGSHSLRKTWGYHAWKAGIDLPRLMIIFNHSSQKQTLDYLCIQSEEIQEVYMKVEL